MDTGIVPPNFQNFDPAYALGQIAPHLLSTGRDYILNDASVAKNKIYVAKPSQSSSNKILHWFFLSLLVRCQTVYRLLFS
jgi:hypothetical protein